MARARTCPARKVFPRARGPLIATTSKAGFSTARMNFFWNRLRLIMLLHGRETHRALGAELSHSGRVPGQSATFSSMR